MKEEDADEEVCYHCCYRKNNVVWLWELLVCVCISWLAPKLGWEATLRKSDLAKSGFGGICCSTCCPVATAMPIANPTSRLPTQPGHDFVVCLVHRRTGGDVLDKIQFKHNVNGCGNMFHCRNPTPSFLADS